MERYIPIYLILYILISVNGERHAYRTRNAARLEADGNKLQQEEQEENGNQAGHRHNLRPRLPNPITDDDKENKKDKDGWILSSLKKKFGRAMPKNKPDEKKDTGQAKGQRKKKNQRKQKKPPKWLAEIEIGMPETQAREFDLKVKSTNRKFPGAKSNNQFEDSENSGTVNICFTPPVGCGELIGKEILKANESIYMQAYGFTSADIINNLIKVKKGEWQEENGQTVKRDKEVKIQVLLDKSNTKDSRSKLENIQDAEIDVMVDKVSAIAHNKIIVIDSELVITGSYNFTWSADNRNAENVLMIRSKKVAKFYKEMFFHRYSKAIEAIIELPKEEEKTPKEKEKGTTVADVLRNKLNIKIPNTIEKVPEVEEEEEEGSEGDDENDEENLKELELDD
ncbi:PLD-like domain-containing protein [Ditylenchus destructor]|uniref:Mitochondrial cardiolipin hydrolase n=1 Tax=Ditylenchus destructor TaxID=166010 RepID=A0AAD4NMC9_9BILA|nr:PLD-like domain-containing protein [Ditylenchus destructor]